MKHHFPIVSPYVPHILVIFSITLTPMKHDVPHMFPIFSAYLSWYKPFFFLMLFSQTKNPPAIGVPHDELETPSS